MILKNKRLGLSVGLFIPAIGIIILSVYGLFYADDPKKIPTTLINKTAFIFTLPDLNGNMISFAAYNGRPVILNFWASWCIPCKEEAGVLEKIWREYKDDGAVVLGVAVNDSIKNLIQFKRDLDLSFTSVKDTAEGDIMLEYGVTGIPETFFIRPDGTIEKKIYGVVRYDQMKTFLAKYIP